MILPCVTLPAVNLFGFLCVLWWPWWEVGLLIRRLGVCIPVMPQPSGSSREQNLYIYSQAVNCSDTSWTWCVPWCSWCSICSTLGATNGHYWKCARLESLCSYYQQSVMKCSICDRCSSGCCAQAWPPSWLNNSYVASWFPRKTHSSSGYCHAGAPCSTSSKRAFSGSHHCECQVWNGGWGTAGVVDSRSHAGALKCSCCLLFRSRSVWCWVWRRAMKDFYRSPWDYCRWFHKHTLKIAAEGHIDTLLDSNKKATVKKDLHSRLFY